MNRYKNGLSENFNILYKARSEQELSLSILTPSFFFSTLELQEILLNIRTRVNTFEKTEEESVHKPPHFSTAKVRQSK